MRALVEMKSVFVLERKRDSRSLWTEAGDTQAKEQGTRSHSQQPLGDACMPTSACGRCRTPSSARPRKAESTDFQNLAFSFGNVFYLNFCARSE